MVQQYGNIDVPRDSRDGYAIIEPSEPSGQEQRLENNNNNNNDNSADEARGPRALPSSSPSSLLSSSRSYVPFSSLFEGPSSHRQPDSQPEPKREENGHPSLPPSSALLPPSPSPSSVSASPSLVPNWMSTVSEELDQDAEKTAVIEETGLFSGSCHRCTGHRVRWLYHWICGDASASDRNDRIRFLKNCMEDTENFQPFTLREGAEEMVTKQQNRIIIRLSGTVPGSIAVTWWDTVRRSPFNKRFRVMETGLLTDGRNTVSNLAQLCLRLSGLLPNVILEHRSRPRPLLVSGYIPC